MWTSSEALIQPITPLVLPRLTLSHLVPDVAGKDGLPWHPPIKAEVIMMERPPPATIYFVQEPTSSISRESSRNTAAKEPEILKFTIKDGRVFAICALFPS